MPSKCRSIVFVLAVGAVGKPLSCVLSAFHCLRAVVNWGAILLGCSLSVRISTKAESRL